MPIVNDLKSIHRREAAGFTHEQAKAIVEAAENGQQNGFNRFVEVLDQRLGEIDNRLRLELQAMREELLKDQRDQILRFAAIVSIVFTMIAALLGAAIKWL